MLFRTINRRVFLAGSAGAGMVALMPGLVQAQETPKQGGRLSTIVNPEPPHLNPALNPVAPTFLVGGKIFQSLLDYDFNLNPQARLADSWTISEDGVTYTFKLRTDVKWHDGQPFTSKDVVFTLTEFLPKHHPRAKGILSRSTSIEAPDEHTVVVTLKSPFPAFISAFDTTTMPILPAHIYQGTDFAKNPANAAPIGTGPFKFKEWARGQYVHLVRNESYWRPGQPYLDEIFFSVIPDGALRALALENGDVDMTSSNDLEFVDIGRLSSTPDIVAEQRGWELFAPHGVLEINVRKPPFDDKRFRKAIMHAIDRDFIKDKIWYGFGAVPTGPIGRRTRFYDANVPTYEYSVDKAKALLDEIGLKPDANGVRLKVGLMQQPFGETWTRTGEYVKQSLQQVGIEAELQAPDVAGWVKNMADWNYDMVFNSPYQFADPALGVARTYITANINKGVAFSNTIGYSNPVIDDLFEKGAAELDQAKRQEIYSEIQRILVDDVAAVWLLELSFPTMYRNKLHDTITTAIGYAADFDNVWVDA